MQVADTLVVIAILVAPVVAVQAQKWIEMIREKRSRKDLVFQALMGTRAAPVSSEHVRALNMIDIVFSTKWFFGRLGPSKPDQAVLDAWRIYRDHLTNRDDGMPEDNQDVKRWLEKKEDLFTEMLYEMGRALRHNFDKVLIMRGIYSPVAHEELEKAQLQIRDYMVGLAKGESSVPISVVTDSEALAKQEAYQQLMIEQLDGTRPLRVQVVEDGSPDGHGQGKLF